MTHYEIDYSELTPQARHEKALADTRDYLGDERYSVVISTLKQMQPRSVDALALMLSMAGIAGYPVSAIHSEVWPYG